MGLSGIFKETQYKKEIEELSRQLETANSLLDNAGRENVIGINNAKNTLSKLNSEIAVAQQKLEDLNFNITEKEKEIAEKDRVIITLDDEINVQSFGLYQPRFPFASSTDYKEALAKIRSMQKEMIKNKTAALGNANWTVNGSKAKGAKMVSDLQKLLLRAFNTECDELISKVKYTNFDASLKKLYAISESISKMTASSVNISISTRYIDLKVKELRLAFEFAQKKQEEKEALRELKAQEREAAKLQKEIAEQRKAIYKEQSHYERALTNLRKQLLENPNDQDLLQKKEDILAELQSIEKSLTDIDYREANQRAGYVYIISNIGAFGENIYKIGMTRRLDPQERVDELGDASVPFNFDVHAMIFSDDAPALESALHKAFADRKVNMVNTRREFFYVTLDEIKEVVKNNFDKTVEFIDVADAEQYRVSQKIRAGETA